MKIKRWIVMLLVTLSLFGMVGCGDKGEENSYEQITPEQAKSIMDTESDYIIIDARTDEEFAEGHIKGAILIPEYEIADRAERSLKIRMRLFLYTAEAVGAVKLQARSL